MCRVRPALERSRHCGRPLRPPPPPDARVSANLPPTPECEPDSATRLEGTEHAVGHRPEMRRRRRGRSPRELGRPLCAHARTRQRPTARGAEGGLWPTAPGKARPSVPESGGKRSLPAATAGALDVGPRETALEVAQRQRPGLPAHRACQITDADVLGRQVCSDTPRRDRSPIPAVSTLSLV